ncbi:hypothetical protein C5167_006110 [Papaver somniferum]|uniref:Uncharacterized protein n=1 Tax=Papaver somniferum TaxID=3469 RepID=A0A4Y7JGD0_PAPSO|nr:hypothetical protein C5167_006110 [Papaver somniferum]
MATKRCWNAKEDEKLVECCKKWLGVDIGKLIMAFGVDTCNIVDPHIESRIKNLKKQTFTIAEVIALGSGIIFDESEKMIKCEKSVFDEWVKTHKQAKKNFG